MEDKETRKKMEFWEGVDLTNNPVVKCLAAIEEAIAKIAESLADLDDRLKALEIDYYAKTKNTPN